METFSALLALCVGNSSVTSGLSSQRPVTRRSDILLDVRLNKRLSKQSSDLRRHAAHCNVAVMDWLSTVCINSLRHICVSKLTIIGSDNDLSPSRRQAIIWTNNGVLLIRILGTNFSNILSEIHAFSFKKMHLKMSSAKWRPFCLGLNVLNGWQYITRRMYYYITIFFHRTVWWFFFNH